MRKLSLWILIGGVILGAAACASSGTSTASAPQQTANVGGRWVGTWIFDPSTAGDGQATVNITQSGNQLKGNIETLTGPHRGRAGFFNASISGNDIQIIGPDATGWLKVNGDEMTGLINGVLPARLTLRRAQ